MIRAQALRRLERVPETVADATQAVAVAKSTEDPALLLQALDLLLQIEGNDTLAAEARATHRRILDALPDGDMRQRVSRWEVAQRIQKL